MTMNDTTLFCDDFHHHHAVYQLGCFVLALGLIVPANTGRPHTVWLRVVFSISSLCFVVWGGAILCWADLFVWNAICFIINTVYAVYLIRIMCPVKLDEDFHKIYSTMFANFNINERTFASLMGTSAGAMVYELNESGKYAIEGRTNCSNQLSMLLQGRMKVTRGGRFLHYIRQGQFIDSPEWEAVNAGSTGSFQVTIHADTDCEYVQWPRKSLESYLKRNSVIRTVFQSGIGRDITEKLYSIGEPEMESVLFLGTEGEINEEHETVLLLVPDDDLLFAHRWERATSIETDTSITRPSVRSQSGATYLTVPGAEGGGSNLSLHRRSLVDIRASMASSGKGSRLSSDDASYSGGEHDYLTPPQSTRGSFTSSPQTPSILID